MDTVFLVIESTYGAHEPAGVWAIRATRDEAEQVAKDLRVSGKVTGSDTFSVQEVSLAAEPAVLN